MGDGVDMMIDSLFEWDDRCDEDGLFDYEEPEDE